MLEGFGSVLRVAMVAAAALADYFRLHGHWTFAIQAASRCILKDCSLLLSLKTGGGTSFRSVSPATSARTAPPSSFCGVVEEIDNVSK